MFVIVPVGFIVGTIYIVRGLLRATPSSDPAASEPNWSWRPCASQEGGSKLLRREGWFLRRGGGS